MNLKKHFRFSRSLWYWVIMIIAIIAVSCETVESQSIQLDDTARATAPGEFAGLPLGKVHYEIEGNENAQTVVLLHGYSVPMYIWDNTFDALVTAGFRTLRLDLYGRGFSDRPVAKYDKDLFISQLTGLLEILEISYPVDLVGMSMGGSISVAFADRYPEKVRKLIFIDTEFTSGSASYPPNYEETGVRLLKEQASSMAESQLGDFFNPDRFPDWPAKYRVQMQFDGFFRAILSTSMYFYQTNFTELYDRVGKQGRDVLIIWGKEDSNIPVEIGERIQSLMPGSKLVVIDKAGHLPHYEQPDKVNPVLIEFLKK